MKGRQIIMENHDFGLFNLALEAEMITNNLTVELMREDAMSVLINEDESGSSKKESFKKKVSEFLKKLKEFWNAIVSKFAQIINKIIASSGVAQKFIAKHKQALSDFGGSNEKIKVNVLITKPERMKEELGHITKATSLANTFLGFRFTSEEQVRHLHTEMQNALSDISKSLVQVNTAKEDIQLTSTLVDEGIKFLTSEYKKGGEALNSIKKKSGEVINKSKQILDEALKADQADESTRRMISWAWGITGRQVAGKLIQVAGRFVSMLNTSYVDYLKVCHKAVSLSKSQDKANSKAKATAGDGKERKDVTPDRTIAGHLN
jgi:hypothetical protein